jgi:hypothetical protein
MKPIPTDWENRDQFIFKVSLLRKDARFDYNLAR